MSVSSCESRYDGLIGQQFGDLTVLAVGGRTSTEKRVLATLRCVCGNEIVWPICRVVSGAKAHCGCKTDYVSRRTHGMRGSPEYQSWIGMKARCLNPRGRDYPRWGGRGIYVFTEWIDSFEAFYEHVGQRPAGTSLDRIDNSKGYVPGNVRWATHREQAENRRDTWVVTIYGVTFSSMAEAARANNVSETTIMRWCEDDGRPSCNRRRRYASCQS